MVRRDSRGREGKEWGKIKLFSKVDELEFRFKVTFGDVEDGKLNWKIVVSFRYRE